MNWQRRYSLTIVFLCSVFLSACVSVSLSSTDVKKADGLLFNQPAAPFAKIKNSSVDLAWQNQKNGNTIAFLSECNGNLDIGLKEIETENLSVLSNMKINESADINYNDREALHTTAEGQVDGVPVEMELILFKKNGCTFTISYVGRHAFFANDRPQFQKFMEGFKVP